MEILKCTYALIKIIIILKFQNTSMALLMNKIIGMKFLRNKKRWENLWREFENETIWVKFWEVMRDWENFLYSKFCRCSRTKGTEGTPRPTTPLYSQRPSCLLCVRWVGSPVNDWLGLGRRALYTPKSTLATLHNHHPFESRTPPPSSPPEKL